MKNDFSTIIGSDIDLEELYAEIQYKNEAVVVLTQEEGFENLKMQLCPRKNGKEWEFHLKDFLEAIEHAKQRLWEMRKIS